MLAYGNLTFSYRPGFLFMRYKELIMQREMFHSQKHLGNMKYPQSSP